MKSFFFYSQTDIQWLMSTHLLPENILENKYVPPFKSFVLVGDMDRPKEIRLFASNTPAATDKPTVFMPSIDSRMLALNPNYVGDIQDPLPPRCEHAFWGHMAGRLGGKVVCHKCGAMRNMTQREFDNF